MRTSDTACIRFMQRVSLTAYICSTTAQMKRTNILLLLLLLPIFSFAWNADGHNTCGAIAYYYLKKNNTKALARVTTILQRHPWYATAKWNDKLAGLTEEERNVALFMLASTYPDEARRNPALGGGQKSKWHYVHYCGRYAHHHGRLVATSYQTSAPL